MDEFKKIEAFEERAVQAFMVESKEFALEQKVRSASFRSAVWTFLHCIAHCIPASYPSPQPKHDSNYMRSSVLCSKKYVLAF